MLSEPATLLDLLIGLVLTGGGATGAHQTINYFLRRRNGRRTPDEAVQEARRDDAIKAVHRRLDELRDAGIRSGEGIALLLKTHEGNAAIDHQTGTLRTWCKSGDLEPTLTALSAGIAENTKAVRDLAEELPRTFQAAIESCRRTRSQ